jgi:cytochrome o ubiquinol oxidase subunit 3
MLSIATNARNRSAVYIAAAVTFVLGASFIGLEINDFSSLVARGFGPSRSAFLSSFFALVGAHGAHVTAGLVWLLVMMAQVATRGFRPSTVRRLYCFTLFWHALDIVWVAVFTIVYLKGVS